MFEKAFKIKLSSKKLKKLVFDDMVSCVVGTGLWYDTCKTSWICRMIAIARNFTAKKCQLKHILSFIGICIHLLLSQVGKRVHTEERETSHGEQQFNSKYMYMYMYSKDSRRCCSVVEFGTLHAVHVIIKV